MDILDEILNQTPKEKFIDILKNANSSSIENAFDDFIVKYIAMSEILEQNGIGEDEINTFQIQNYNNIQKQKNDIFIGLVADILGQEG